MGKFVVFKGKNDQFRFNLKAGNGEVIATSESYSSLASCRNGIESVRKNALAPVEDQTAGEEIKNPKFELYQDKAGEYRFRLKATNGQIIAISEGYVKMASCMNGIDSVRKNAVDAPVEEEEEE